MFFQRTLGTLVTLAGLASFSGCVTAADAPSEPGEVVGQALSPESCPPAPAPVPSGFFRGPCKTMGTGNIKVTTCTCYPNSPTNPTVALDWAMPDMTGFDTNADGVVDLSPPSKPPGTPPGAASLMTPSSWAVTLDACQSTPAPSYSWAVAGLPPIPTGPSCLVGISVPAQGTYHATATANYGNGRRSVNRDITVKNFVVVSLGDSIASGEGNPDVPASWTTDVAKIPFTNICFQYEINPFDPGSAHCSTKSWPDGPAVWETPSCHRSAKSGPALAALALERSDRHSSVTFISEACSGATILQPDGVPAGSGGLLQSYAGEDPDALKGGARWVPQIAAVARALCPASANVPTTTDLATSTSPTDLTIWTNPVKSQCRPIDALVVTAGGNDADFGTAAVGCSVPQFDCTTNVQITQNVGDAIAALPAHLNALDTGIRNALNVNSIFFAEYPDPTHDQTGQLCKQIVLPHAIDDAAGKAVGMVGPVGGYFLDIYLKLGINVGTLAKGNLHDGIMQADEVKFLHDHLVVPLNSAVATAAQNNHWNLITGIAADFQTHGYCSTDPWVVKYPDSVHDELSSDGTFHPNAMGHRNYEQHIFNALFDHLISGGHPPVITKQPVSLTVSPGGTADFFVNDTSNCGLLQNQWQFNGNNLTDGPGISGSTGSLHLTNVTAAQAGDYRVVVTCANGQGTTISSAATLTVKPTGAPPVITSQPTSLTATTGSTVNFIVTDTTTCGLVRNQWQFNGVDLIDVAGLVSGSTGLLKLTNVTETQTGTYTDVITCANGAGATASKPITLVVKPVSGAPVITQEPASTVAASGGSAVFIANYSSTCGTPVGQWQFNGVNLTDGPNIKGSTTATLQLSNVTAAQTGTYTVTLSCSNGAGSTTSNPATLTVELSQTNAPIVTTQPAPVTVAMGGQASFSIGTSSSCAALTEQWQLNGVALTDGPQASGAQVAGSNALLLSLTGVTAAEAGNYTVVVACADGSASTVSNAATLTVGPGGLPPVITTQPTSMTVVPGTQVVFNATVTSTCGPTDQTWMFTTSTGSSALGDGPNVKGSNTPQLVLTNVSSAQAGTYLLFVSCPNGAGFVSSNAVTLTIDTTSHAPIITQQPVSQQVAPGGTVTFTFFDATSCGLIQNQWQFNGVNMIDGPNVSGSKGQLQLTNVTPAQNGSYRVVVTCANGQGTTTSEPATLDVAFGLPALITGEPPPLTVIGKGQTATLAAAFTSFCGAVSPQWEFNGVALKDSASVAGSTTTTLTLTNVTAAQGGTYNLVLTCVNGAGSATSEPAGVVVQ